MRLTLMTTEFLIGPQLPNSQLKELGGTSPFRWGVPPNEIKRITRASVFP